MQNAGILRAMNRVVLDASAILTVLGREPGWEKLTPRILNASVCSTVNLAEVQSKLVTRGLKAQEAWEAALSPVRESVAFSMEHAKIAGSLISETRPLGLSLGDRACLALGISLGVPVYTAVRLWKGLKLGVRIHIIR